MAAATDARESEIREAEMNNDALVAALGMDAVAAVRGYRKLVVAEARQQGLRLVSEEPATIVQATIVWECGQAHVVDPIDIRLVFRHSPARPGLAGRTLCWGPAHGWSVSHRTANVALAHFAGPDATPLQLVPTVPAIVRWAAGDPDGPAAPPADVELDDDPRAIRRLLGFVDRTHPIRGYEDFRPADPLARRTG